MIPRRRQRLSSSRVPDSYWMIYDAASSLLNFELFCYGCGSICAGRTTTLPHARWDLAVLCLRDRISTDRFSFLKEHPILLGEWMFALFAAASKMIPCFCRQDPRLNLRGRYCPVRPTYCTRCLTMGDTLDLCRRGIPSH